MACNSGFVLLFFLTTAINYFANNRAIKFSTTVRTLLPKYELEYGF